MLTVLDEYSRECLAIVVARRLQADDVLQTLSELFAARGPSQNLRSDNGPEFTAKVVRTWLGELGVRTLFIIGAVRLPCRPPIKPFAGATQIR